MYKYIFIYIMAVMKLGYVSCIRGQCAQHYTTYAPCGSLPERAVPYCYTHHSGMLKFLNVYNYTDTSTDITCPYTREHHQPYNIQVMVPAPSVVGVINIVHRARINPTSLTFWTSVVNH